MKTEEWMKLEYEEVSKLLKDNFEDMKKVIQLTLMINAGLFVAFFSNVRMIPESSYKIVPLVIALLAILINTWLIIATKRFKKKSISLFTKLSDIEDEINNLENQKNTTYKLSVYKNLQQIENETRPKIPHLPSCVVQALWTICAIWMSLCIYCTYISLENKSFEICSICEIHREKQNN